jgi:hypothetical protein
MTIQLIIIPIVIYLSFWGWGGSISLASYIAAYFKLLYFLITLPIVLILGFYGIYGIIINLDKVKNVAFDIFLHKLILKLEKKRIVVHEYNYNSFIRK